MRLQYENIQKNKQTKCKGRKYEKREKQAIRMGKMELKDKFTLWRENVESHADEGL